jgi:hypothetical protein
VIFATGALGFELPALGFLGFYLAGLPGGVSDPVLWFRRWANTTPGLIAASPPAPGSFG